MFAFIDGRVCQVAADYFVLECQQIGYKLYAPESSLRSLQAGQELRVYTSMVLRENQCDLYGFGDEGSRKLFELLLTVSRVGPKLASQLLSDLDSEALITAVLTGDSQGLTRVKGLGKKGAERLILELKDKLYGLQAAQLQQGAAKAGPKEGSERQRQDLEAALLALGYSQRELEPVLDEVCRSEEKLEQQLRRALRLLARQ